MSASKTEKGPIRAEFNEVGAYGIFIADTKADPERSMDLLRQNGLRALTSYEASTRIDQDQELKERLKGRWLYLDGKGTDLSEFYIRR